MSYPLAQLIEQFRKEVWSNALTVTAEEVEGLCTEYAHEFCAWLSERNVRSKVVYLSDAAQLYPERSRIPMPDEGHAVVAVMGELVDWTCAQYGISEFPARRVDELSIPE